MKRDWFWFFVFFVMMAIIGYVIFDNIAAKLIFAIVVGGLFGWVFSGKKTKKEKE